jgi:hypothetical protein
VSDLRERMRMLQGDRRANVDLLETHKKLNATEVNTMREDNKALRQQLAQLKRRAGLGSGGADDEIDSMKSDMVKQRKEYDELKGQSTKMQATLSQLKDDVQACGMEAVRPSDQDTPLTRSIRVLENRLDKAMIKYNEATSIRKTYEQVRERSRIERSEHRRRASEASAREGGCVRASGAGGKRRRLFARSPAPPARTLRSHNEGVRGGRCR